MNHLFGSKEFNDHYVPTIFFDFSFYKRDSIVFHIFDLAGDESLEPLRKRCQLLCNYKSTSIIIYALDATEDANKNKKILRDFQTVFQLIVFTKSVDKKSNRY